ncbi:hypothetical protein TNCV_2411681 [Trichonephila clavipes]|nr:hypothetical protein TNCV_2411681 [Trichonephila clavipes]
MPHKCSVAASTVMWQQELATDILSFYTHDYPTDVAEGKKPLLYFTSALGLSLGTVAHAYVDKEDSERVMISDAWEHARRKNGSTTTPAGLIRSYQYC